MALHFIPIEQYDSYKPATIMARAKAIESKVLHAVRRTPEGSFEVCRSAKGRLGEFQKFAHESGYSCANYDPKLLRGFCMNLGLSPAGWRFIHQHGDSAYEAILQSYPFEEGLFEAVMKYVEWQAHAGLESPLPILLGKVCTMVFEAGFASLRSCSSRLALEAFRYWQTLQTVSIKEDYVATQWRPVLKWIHNDQPSLQSNQWRSGWPAIFKAFQKANKAHKKSVKWRSMLGPFRAHGFEVVPLVSADQIELEGEAMDHCVADYIELCELGEYRLFSLRKKGTHGRVATVGLEYNGKRWCLDQAKGPSNADPSAEVLALSSEIASMYQLSQG